MTLVFRFSRLVKHVGNPIEQETVCPCTHQGDGLGNYLIIYIYTHTSMNVCMYVCAKVREGERERGYMHDNTASAYKGNFTVGVCWREAEE